MKEVTIAENFSVAQQIHRNYEIPTNDLGYNSILSSMWDFILKSGPIPCRTLIKQITFSWAMICLNELKYAKFYSPEEQLYKFRKEDMDFLEEKERENYEEYYYW